MYYQHGDVLIKKVEKIPSSAKRKRPSNRGNVLADGEATGHAHVMTPDKTELYEDDGTLYLTVKESTPVTHEEHNPIEIEAGDYEIGIVQEYDHFAEEVRVVKD